VNLDEMLALLPDNDTGDISAADLRAIVTELHELASTLGQVFSYQWTPTAPVNTGRLTMDVNWDPSATKLLISETTDSGQVLSFEALDGSSARVRLASGGSLLHADVTGPSVDLGNYREVPIAVTEVIGSAPAANAKVQVGVLAVLL
jgi:hypothetical protein